MSLSDEIHQLINEGDNTAYTLHQYFIADEKVKAKVRELVEIIMSYHSSEEEKEAASIMIEKTLFPQKDENEDESQIYLP